MFDTFGSHRAIWWEVGSLYVGNWHEFAIAVKRLHYSCPFISSNDSPMMAAFWIYCDALKLKIQLLMTATLVPTHTPSCRDIVSLPKPSPVVYLYVHFKEPVPTFVYVSRAHLVKLI